MAARDKGKQSRVAVPAELRERMKTEHGDWLGRRMVAIGNFYTYEPRQINAREHGLVEDEITVLGHLYDWGGSTANVICSLAGRPKNSISRAVNRLIDRAMIRTETDDADRRRSILTITDEGRALYERAISPFRAQEERMFGCLTKRETEQLDALLLKILRNWSDEFDDE